MSTRLLEIASGLENLAEEIHSFWSLGRQRRRTEPNSGEEICGQVHVKVSDVRARAGLLVFESVKLGGLSREARNYAYRYEAYCLQSKPDMDSSKDPCFGWFLFGYLCEWLSRELGYALLPERRAPSIEGGEDLWRACTVWAVEVRASEILQSSAENSSGAESSDVKLSENDLNVAKYHFEAWQAATGNAVARGWGVEHKATEITPEVDGKRNTKQPERLTFKPGLFSLDGKEVSLHGKPWQVLKQFAHSSSGILTVDDLLDAVWGNSPIEAASVKNHISLIRKAMAPLLPKDWDPFPCRGRGRDLAWQLNLPPSPEKTQKDGKKTL